MLKLLKQNLKHIYTAMGEQCYNSRLPALLKHNLCCGGVVVQTRIQLKTMLHLHFASIMQSRKVEHHLGDQHLIGGTGTRKPCKTM